MVLILSDETDHSTAEIIRWLNLNKKDFIRINRHDLFNKVKIKLTSNGGEIIIDGKKRVDLNDITSYWFRRGQVKFGYEAMSEDTEGVHNAELVEIFREREIRILEEYLHTRLDEVHSISSFFTRGLNKLNVLQAAQGLGIEIPETIVTSEKDELVAFYEEHQPIITKAISEIPIFQIYDDPTILILTETVKPETIEKLPDSFFPSLFQKRIDKKYELRIFYLDGKFSTMAIFSQQDSKTTVDFRNYNYKYPNRTVAFELPQMIERKLDRLMKKLSLNCGSIDMIVSNKNEFIFLEINPIGQFGMTSRPCNFNLEKDIADFLCNNSTNTKEKTIQYEKATNERLYACDVC